VVVSCLTVRDAAERTDNSNRVIGRILLIISDSFYSEKEELEALPPCKKLSTV